MHIAIENQNRTHGAFSDQAAGGKGKIVEHAKARAIIKMGVVRAACGMTGKAMGQRMTRRQHRAVHRQKGPVAQNRTPFQAKHPQRLFRQAAFGNRRDIVRAVNKAKIVWRGGGWRDGGEMPKQPLIMKAGYQLAEFCGWKAVPVRQWNVVVGVGYKGQHTQTRKTARTTKSTAPIRWRHL